jgi:flagellar hook-length control protein FliK
MTDEELFADVKQLMGEAESLLEELASDLQIPVEELKGQIGDKAAELKSSQESVEIVAAGPGKQTDEVRDRLTSFEETDPQVKADDTEEIAPVSARHEDDKRQGAGNERREGAEHMNFTQTVTDTLKGMVADRVEETVPTYATTTDRIMEQVSESLRMTMTEDITEMEMTLHPASLGNVRVQVAAKDGVITASFTTENQQVKEVLEAQMIQLKDQMNEQGIKIEAVEVTVSAHAFERNLSDNGENRGGQPEAEAKKKKVRGINLGSSDLSELDLEELDEEDKVTADMMARQGNTVDYMA